MAKKVKFDKIEFEVRKKTFRTETKNYTEIPNKMDTQKISNCLPPLLT